MKVCSINRALLRAVLVSSIAGAASAFTVGSSSSSSSRKVTTTLWSSTIPGPGGGGGPRGVPEPQYSYQQDRVAVPQQYQGSGHLEAIEDSDFTAGGMDSSLAYYQDQACIPPGADWIELFPQGTFREGDDMETIQGGKTVRTYKMPGWADCCQYIVATNGRPLKVEVGLWLGPLRSTHTMKIDSEDGNETPYMATLRFKALAQMLRIITSDSVEFPVKASVYVPPPDRASELKDNTAHLWKNAGPTQKMTVQGGSVQGGGGAIRWWQVPPEVQSVQIISWAKDTSKKSFKGKIWVLQGPNTVKQDYFLQCGGGSQPYHGVIQTPGDGCTIGIQNKKFLEDGLFEFAVLPYEVQPGYTGIGPEALGSSFADKPYESGSADYYAAAKKRWWLK